MYGAMIALLSACEISENIRYTDKAKKYDK